LQAGLDRADRRFEKRWLHLFEALSNCKEEQQKCPVRGSSFEHS